MKTKVIFGIGRHVDLQLFAGDPDKLADSAFGVGQE